MRHALWFATLAILFSFPISAADHPSFTGTWKLDAQASDFGPMPALSSLTDQIEQTPTGVVIHRVRDGQKLEINIPLDGTGKQNNILGVDMQTQGHWDGNTLVVEFAGTRRGNLVTYTERWTLSPDGKGFQVARHLTGRMGSTDQKLVLVKQ